MQPLKSFEDLQQQVAEIRALRLGFITNFFPDPVKHTLWIKKGDCFIDRVGNTLFIIKKSPNFWNVFYCSTTIDSLETELKEFQKLNPGITMMFDLVGRDIQCQPLVEKFKGLGCKEATSLVRMTRMTEPMEYVPDETIRYATESDLPLISQQLHQYFDERTEQIPYDEELIDYSKEKRVLVCEENGVIMGHLIFELNATTLYLRYWFTHPDYRDKKVGSRLLRRFFEEGKDTMRQLFWVIRTNENAIKRYKHYGFNEENMFDFVMQYN
jgi:N-acetylglutamate synthase-like GNAT family acetyltransferase